MAARAGFVTRLDVTRRDLPGRTARYIEQLSIQEIMAVLSLKESAVNLRLLRALQRHTGLRPPDRAAVAAK